MSLISMFFRGSRGRLVLACTAVLAACGGGGGSGGDSPAPGNQGGPVTVTLPSITGHRVWLAYQDGDGPWKVVSPGSSSYTLQIQDPAGRYGLVFVDDLLPPDNAYIGAWVSNFYLTRQESATVDLSKYLRDARGDVRVSGVFTGAAPQAQCSVSLAGRYVTTVNPCQSYAFNSVPAGPTDAVATYMNSALVAERMVVKRNVSLGAGTTVDFDFSSIGPLSGLQTASLAGTAALPGDERSFRAQWVSGGARAVLSNSVSTLSYPLVASSARVAGDHYLAYANYDTRQGVTTGFRSASYQSQSGTGQTLNMPQPANSIQVGYLTGPVGPRPTLTWSPVSGSLLSLMATYPLTDPSAPIWEFRFSKGWIKGGSSYSYSFPDLSSLGWESRWSLRSGTPLGFYYEESATSVPFPGFYAVGSREVFADNTNWYTGIETELTLPTATKASEAHAVVTDQATPGDGILGIVRRSTTFDAIAERRFRRN